MTKGDTKVSETKVLAFLGKGGTGKTVLSALSGKIAIGQKKKLLFVDADPAMGLTTALGITGIKTIGQAREEIIGRVKNYQETEEEDIRGAIDYFLMETLYETPDYCMYAMGHTDTIGCYCPVNNLLRETIDSVAENFDVVIIDAEAGIEQINRQVTARVHFPVLVTDNTVRGVRTTILARETIAAFSGMNPVLTGVLFNRVEHADDALREQIVRAGLTDLGSVPADAGIAEFDRTGRSILELPEDSRAVTALRAVFSQNGIL